MLIEVGLEAREREKREFFASYAIGDFLTRNDTTGLQRYRSFIRAEYASYATTRANYYREEQRWPESEFWQRRHTA